MSNEGKSLQSTESKKIDAKSGEKEKALSLVVGQIERNFGKVRSCVLATPQRCG